MNILIENLLTICAAVRHHFENIFYPEAVSLQAKLIPVRVSDKMFRHDFPSVNVIVQFSSGSTNVMH